MIAVVLVNPKTPANVGGVLRACAAFGVTDLSWTGERVLDRSDLAGPARMSKRKWRLPREERIDKYDHVQWARSERRLDALIEDGLEPVCVERTTDACPLPLFVHPENAVYVFGPEDGGVPKGHRALCHHFVTIPAAPQYPNADSLNLAAAVNVVLYDRRAKQMLAAEQDAFYRSFAFNPNAAYPLLGEGPVRIG
jgi:tRNA(Leu) C34 or U34 (ribose-2'-O)-methylase TrmL